MAELERRFWDRVGMYVTRDFAEEWIEKMAESSSTGGKHLDEDIEEYIVSMPPTSVELRNELNDLFEAPFEKVDYPKDIKAILYADKMERNRVAKLKELKAEGHTLEEAKEIFQKELDVGVAEILGVEVGSLAVGLGVAPNEDSGADVQDDRN